MSSDSEDERKTFNSTKEEVKYWKEKAKDYKKRLVIKNIEIGM